MQSASVLQADVLEQVGAAYLPLLEKLQFDRIAGLPYAAIPIATAISLAGNYPMIYPRKEVKEYGTKAQIEGDYHPGETIAVIDDLATTGGSKFEAIEKLTGAGLVVKDVVAADDCTQLRREVCRECPVLHWSSRCLRRYRRRGRRSVLVAAR